MIFDSRSVAVVGASDDPAKVGGSVLANLVAGGFPGRVVPVNASRATVQGLPSVRSILDAPDPIDVAVIAVPAPSVLGVLKECVTAGVAGAVVISAGFGESGAVGGQREGELRAWLRGQPIRVLGPNCLGWMRPARRLNLTFAPGMPAAVAVGPSPIPERCARPSSTGRRDHHVGFSLFAS